MSFRNYGPACLRGRQMRPNEAIILYPEEETDFRTTAPFDVFMMAVEQERFEQHAIAILGCPLSDLRKNERLALPALTAIRRNEDELLSIVTVSPQRHQRLLSEPATARAFERRVIDRVLGAVDAPATQVSATRRRKLAWHAQEYLRTRLNPEFSSRIFCLAVGTTARTLHRGFLEQFRTTPKAYLKMLRLNRFRDDVRAGVPGTTVTDIAIRWGFFHLGLFSQDPVAMFGDAPSQILRAARG